MHRAPSNYGRKSLPTAYDVLQVHPKASTAVIEGAYRALAKIYHPDLHPGDKKKEALMKVINEAYHLIDTPAKRQAYDRSIGL